jgi:NDP-sugar pyrophosphorylase family protein
MTQIRHALIMAAGRGMRMMPLTDSIPKPMVTLDGSTLISRGIDFLEKKIGNIHITVGYKGNLVAEHVTKKRVNSIFNTDGHGNAWWIYHTLMQYLDEPVLVLTCDNVIELDIGLLNREYSAFGSPPCLVVPVPPVEGLEGDFIFHENNVVTELSRSKRSDIYCSGIQIVNPAQINRLTKPTDNFYDLWKELIDQKKLYSSTVYPTKWTAIDTMDQLNNLSGI